MRSPSAAVLDPNAGFPEPRIRDGTRLTKAEVARRYRAREKKGAASARVDWDHSIVELLIRNRFLSRDEATGNAKGLRKIGEAMYRYLSIQARKEIY